MIRSHETAPALDLSLRALSFAQALVERLYAQRLLWCLGLASLFISAHFWSLAINWGESLPGHLYLIHKTDRTLERGGVVAFRWHGTGPYPQGITFTKIVAGIPGDTVRFQGREVFVNDVHLASAKPFSRTGEPLQLGPTGVIPAHRFYVHAPHPDSLDSRYAITGWIDSAQVLGRAQRLF